MDNQLFGLAGAVRSGPTAPAFAPESLDTLRGIVYHGPQWIAVMNASIVQLAPRGFGRSSYHLSEIIQMGFIPVYVYDDKEWLPYRNTSVGAVQNFGFSLRINQVRAWAVGWQAVPRARRLADIVARRARMLQAVDSHWTYSGVMQHIEWFLKQDKRSDLVCRRHPMFFDFDRYEYRRPWDPNRLG